jgi:hypothetical protein
MLTEAYFVPVCKRRMTKKRPAEAGAFIYRCLPYPTADSRFLLRPGPRTDCHLGCRDRQRRRCAARELGRASYRQATRAIQPDRPFSRASDGAAPLSPGDERQAMFWLRRTNVWQRVTKPAWGGKATKKRSNQATKLDLRMKDKLTVPT